MGILRLRLSATGSPARLVALLVTLVGLLAATPAGTTVRDDAIIDALNRDGRYLDLGDDNLDDAVDRANAEGVAFAWIDAEGDGPVADAAADELVLALEEQGSRYRTVLVLLRNGFGASSVGVDPSELNRALDAAQSSFAAGSTARGVDDFTTALTGLSTTATTTPGSTDGAGGSSDGGGFGFGSFLLLLAALGGGFMLFRGWSNGRKRKKQAAIDMEEDRAEIKEQLKNNADRVISLGDRVIAKGDRELIVTYEEASATYQDVSQSVDGAITAEEVDALDDRIDHAEWQFESIEAGLDGRPTPPSPAERQAAEAAKNPPPPPQGQPPPTADDSRSAGRDVATSPRTGRRYPRSSGRQRRSGGLGGLGGGLGSILGSVILGGGLGGGGRSRRSQRRGGGFGTGGGAIGGARRSGRGGGLGGGVLRRGGSGGRSSRPRSRSRSQSRSRSRSRSSSGGRSFGRSRSRGGRSF